MTITLRIKTIGYLSAVCATFMAFGVSAEISGSKHDFTQNGNLSGVTDQICVYCHTPHNADTSQTLAPLWNHEIDLTTTYTTYQGFDMDATVGDPSGISLLCLSCHDGTIAVDAFINDPIDYNPADWKIPTNHNAYIGTDISDDHPISIVYAEAEVDPEIYASSTALTIGGTIDDLLTADGTLECSSCHDVHDTNTLDDPLLRISVAGSELCLNCHNK